jgi:hypothetical protein
VQRVGCLVREGHDRCSAEEMLDVTTSAGPLFGDRLLLYIKDMLLLAPRSLQAALRRDFIPTIDFHRSLAADRRYNLAPRVLQWWCDLASAAEVSEYELRAGATVECKVVIGTATASCSWFKCVMFDRDNGTEELFRRARCKKAMYCGPLCQTRCASRIQVVSLMSLMSLSC